MSAATLTISDQHVGTLLMFRRETVRKLSGYQDQTSWSLEQSWSKPSERNIRKLAESEPKRLLDLMKTFEPPALALAARIAGSLIEDEAVADVLLEVLNHEYAYVREAAAYGLANHLTDEARAALEKVGTMDPSMAVREAAEQVLDLE